jgi:hypothetical protein
MMQVVTKIISILFRIEKPPKPKNYTTFILKINRTLTIDKTEQNILILFWGEDLK